MPMNHSRFKRCTDGIEARGLPQVESQLHPGRKKLYRKTAVALGSYRLGSKLKSFPNTDRSRGQLH